MESKNSQDTELKNDTEVDVLENVSTDIERSELHINDDQDASHDVQEGKKTSSKEEQKSFMREVFEWIRIFVIAVVIALLINNFLIINANVPTGSMENTIVPKDHMIGLRASYWFSAPKRGDIVIFNNPEYVDGTTSPESKLYVKRVIGQPGEKITIKEAQIYINDSQTPLKETYLKEEWYIMAGFASETHEGDGVLRYYVPKKGDKIIVKDGRKYLDGEEIKLKDDYLTKGELQDGEYTMKFNCYFVLGDNRNDSSDARYWRNTSYVSDEDILARAVLGYYPWRGLYDRPDYNS